MEKEVAGMCFSGNLLDSYSLHVDSLAARKISELLDTEQVKDKENARVTGIVTSVTVKTTRKNERMAFFSIEDKFGEIECIAFPNILERNRDRIREDSALCVDGSISLREDEEPKLLVNRIFELVENSEYSSKSAEQTSEQTNEKKAVQAPTSTPATLNNNVSKIYLRVPDLSSKEYLKAKNLVDIFEGGVKVIFYDTSKKQYINYERGIDLSQYIYRELVSLLGEENVVPK